VARAGRLVERQKVDGIRRMPEQPRRQEDGRDHRNEDDQSRHGRPIAEEAPQRTAERTFAERGASDDDGGHAILIRGSTAA
jgi:hypothetical protein